MSSAVLVVIALLLATLWIALAVRDRPVLSGLAYYAGAAFLLVGLAASH